MYDVFIVIVYILRLFFVLYGNTASYLETDDFLFTCSCLEQYILEICIDFYGIPFHKDDALLVNLPGLASESIISK